jgi:cell division protein FtsL
MSIIPNFALIVNVNLLCYNVIMKKNNGYLRVIIGLVVLYLLYVVGRTLYQSYQVRKELDDLQVSITQLQQSNKDLGDEIVYYQSSSYQEKIARERLGLQMPGEQVIVILPEQTKQVVTKDPDENLPNYQKWWKFFFKS